MRVVHDGDYYIIFNPEYEVPYSMYTYLKGVYIVDSSYYAKDLIELKEILEKIDPLNAELICAKEALQLRLDGR